MIVLTASLTTQVISFDSKNCNTPMQMIWCGEDSVVLHWKNFGCMMVGPYGHCVKFTYDGSLYLSQEPDCCRIFTQWTCEVLQRVPKTTEEITKIGSTSPAAMLFDAQEAFECGDAKADENIRSIAEEGHLPEAVSQCIEAAGDEFDVDRQRALLKAAAYGQHFCPDDRDAQQLSSYTPHEAPRALPRGRPCQLCARRNRRPVGRLGGCVCQRLRDNSHC